MFNKSYGNGLPWLKEVKFLDESNISRSSNLLFAKSGFGSSEIATKEFFKRMLFVKSLDWAEEKEWRFIFPECGRRIFAINSITCGLRTIVDSEHALVSLVRNLRKHPKTYQIIRMMGTLGLERVELTRTSKYWTKVGDE